MSLYNSINQLRGLIVPENHLIATICMMFLAAPFLVSETGQAFQPDYVIAGASCLCWPSAVLCLPCGEWNPHPQ